MLETLLKKLKDMPEGEERDALTSMVANQMKRCLYNWNKDAMDEEKVAADLSEYTEGKVQLDLDHFRFASLQTRSLAVASMNNKMQRRNNKKKF